MINIVNGVFSVRCYRIKAECLRASDVSSSFGVAALKTCVAVFDGSPCLKREVSGGLRRISKVEPAPVSFFIPRRSRCSVEAPEAGP